MAATAMTGCREKGCPWKGDLHHCPWHSDEATYKDNHAWDTPGGYARYRGNREGRRP